MGLFSFLYDDTNKRKRAIAYPGFHDYLETVSGSAKTEFTLDMNIDDNHAIDISIDGRDQPIEGDPGNWTRDSSTNKIIVAESLSEGKVFKARIYLK